MGGVPGLAPRPSQQLVAVFAEEGVRELGVDAICLVGP